MICVFFDEDCTSISGGDVSASILEEADTTVVPVFFSVNLRGFDSPWPRSSTPPPLSSLVSRSDMAFTQLWFTRRSPGYTLVGLKPP